MNGYTHGSHETARAVAALVSRLHGWAGHGQVQHDGGLVSREIDHGVRDAVTIQMRLLGTLHLG